MDNSVFLSNAYRDTKQTFFQQHIKISTACTKNALYLHFSISAANLQAKMPDETFPKPFQFVACIHCVKSLSTLQLSGPGTEGWYAIPPRNVLSWSVFHLFNLFSSFRPLISDVFLRTDSGQHRLSDACCSFLNHSHAWIVLLLPSWLTLARIIPLPWTQYLVPCSVAVDTPSVSSSWAFLIELLDLCRLFFYPR